MTDEELELFPVSESAKRMLSYVTEGFYDRSYVGKWMFQVMGAEYDEARRIAEELADQFFPETATWGLKYHEIKWQLPVRENLSYEERRRLIYQKRDYRAPMTPATMETYLKNALDFDVYVCDAHDAGPYGYVPPHPNVFKVFFVGEETLDTKKAYKMIDELKQSHTTYKINDRMEIVIDESDIEAIRLLNVKNHFTMPFWDCRIFDGSWCFDGSVVYDGSKRRYSLVLGLKYNLGGIVSREDIKLISAAFLIHTNTEESYRARVHHHFGLNFWNLHRFFDGGWDYDGSVLFDNVRRYDVRISAGHRMEIIEQSQDARLYSMLLKWGQHTGEIMNAGMAVRIIEELLTEWSSEASLTVGSEISGQETVDNLTVETRTRDCWFYDGSVLFDGSKSFNSIYRKEAIE